MSQRRVFLAVAGTMAAAGLAFSFIPRDRHTGLPSTPAANNIEHRVSVGGGAPDGHMPAGGTQRGNKDDNAPRRNITVEGAASDSYKAGRKPVIEEK